jgi:hypothetical protein
MAGRLAQIYDRASRLRKSRVLKGVPRSPAARPRLGDVHRAPRKPTTVAQPSDDRAGSREATEIAMQAMVEAAADAAGQNVS